MEPTPISSFPPPPPELDASQAVSAINPFERNLKRSRIIRLVSIVAGSLFLLGGGIALYSYFTDAGILILEPDKSFGVTLNGVAAPLTQQSDGVYIRTSPGLYRLTLSKPGFEPFLADLRVSRGQTIKIRPIFAVLPKTTDLANTTVDYVRPSLDGKYIYYLGNNRQTVYRVEVGTQTQIPITSDLLKDVRDIQWSDQPDLALIVQGDGTYLQEIPRYDFVHQDKVKIGGSEISSPVWDPSDSNRLAFAYHPGTGEHSLVFSDKRLTTLDRKIDISAITDPRLTWSPNSDYILLVDQNTDASKRNLWVYRTVDGSLKQLTSAGNIASASFAPNSGTILYGMGDTTDLHAINVDGSAERDLNIQATVAQAAWKDAVSFYIPDAAHNLLALYHLDAAREVLPFSFPQSAVQGMTYFPNNQVLTFYTASSIYLADLAK